MSTAAVSHSSSSSDALEPVATPTKRSFFSFGRKKKEKPEAQNSISTESTPTQHSQIVSDKPPQLPALTSVPAMTISPSTGNSTSPQIPAPKKSPKMPKARAPAPPPLLASPASPRSLASSSTSPPPGANRPTTSPDVPSSPSPPRLSTSSSMIFERNVQEQSSVSSPASTAIPAHLQTENHVAPVLDASSLAITDSHISPDQVEIVMHSAHQPAVSVVAPGPTQSSTTASSPVEQRSMHSFRQQSPDRSTYDGEDTAASSAVGDDMASYTASSERRRLSFISFADVVQSEQDAAPAVTSSRGSSSRGSPVARPVDIPGATTIEERLRRSPSPIRGLSASPPKFALEPKKEGSGDSEVRQDGRDGLMVETMRQALRKTESGDLAQASRISSGPGSPLARGREEA